MCDAIELVRHWLETSVKLFCAKNTQNTHIASICFSTTNDFRSQNRCFNLKIRKKKWWVSWSGFIAVSLNNLFFMILSQFQRGMPMQIKTEKNMWFSIFKQIESNCNCILMNILCWLRWASLFELIIFMVRKWPSCDQLSFFYASEICPLQLRVMQWVCHCNCALVHRPKTVTHSTRCRRNYKREKKKTITHWKLAFQIMVYMLLNEGRTLVFLRKFTQNSRA